MRLKELDIKGFKSFPDRTIVGFKDGITAIVGPNGSGKSNISDAIRWVLGEQSAKTLRGSKMEDVIFTGTEARKALGFCEVTITFDNSSGKIPIDYNEVAITRRVFRTGESEYYINKNGCRLKDVRELIMDTGIGKEGYSIIGQGKIEEILSNRAEDRRSIFEEAAGIVKYKSKKEESERKLLRTEENMLRVNDLVIELEDREKSLKSQAEKAILYKDLYNELKNLDINIYINNIEDSKNKAESISKKIDIIYKDIKNKEYLLEDKRKTTDKIKEEYNKNQIEYNEKIDKKYELFSILESEKGNINILDEKENYNQKDIERLREENNSSKEIIANKEDENRKLNESILDLKDILNKYSLDYEKESILLKEKIEEIKKDEELLEENKNKVMEIYNSISDNKSKLNSIDSFNDNISKRLEQLEKSIEGLDEEHKEKLDAKEKCYALKSEIEDEISRDKLKRTSNNEEYISMEKHVEELNKEINNLNIKLQTNISNYKVFKSMEDSYEGYYKGVKEILKASEKDSSIKNNLIGVVADLIKVDETYEVAINAALGGSAQYIVTPTQNSGKIIIEYLRKNKLGRVTCLPLDTIKSRTINIKEDRAYYKVVGLASEIVEFNPKYTNIIENLLGKTIIVEDLENGIKLSNKYKNSLRIVTLEGDIINPGGSMTGGSQGRSNSNILSRKNKIEKIKEDIGKYKLQKETTEDKYEEMSLLIKNKKLDMESLNEKIKIKEYDFLNLDNKLNNLTEEINRLESLKLGQIEEIKSLNKEKSNYKKEKIDLEIAIDKLEKKLEDLQNKTDKLGIKVRAAKDENDELSSANTETKIIINKKENELRNLKSKLEENISIINNNKNKIQDRIENQNKLIKEINEIKLEKEEASIKIHKLEEKQKTIESQLLQIEDRKKTLDANLKKEEEELTKIIKILEGLRQEYSKKELDIEKLKIRLETLLEGLYDEYELEYESAMEYYDGELDIILAKEESKKISQKIKRLGNINLGAILEYEELDERLELILSQQKDLSNAKNDLKKVIKDIEKEMNEKFIKSFNLINKNFKEIFKVLFNGGKANLVLSDEDDILNTGIEIEAQPPGKRLQNLTSLSGGERSLTAVALLFAILKIKPSPFCILDEIDAALDEANIGRYTKYLEEISDETQFIIITHRKTTMEMADTLYGITMEEKGVSKLLAVELTDYGEEAI